MASRGGRPAVDAEHEAAVDFEYADERRARTVAAAVRVEVDEIADDRSRADVTRDGRTVRVVVTAADLVALRAGVNTWMRLLGVAEDVAADSARIEGGAVGDREPDASGDQAE